jgi:hypothetical protein
LPQAFAFRAFGARTRGNILRITTVSVDRSRFPFQCFEFQTFGATNS